MKIYAARKIGYDAEGLRRAVEYLCEQVCDRNNLPGYKITDYAVELHGNRPYLECSIRFDNAEYTHIKYPDTGYLTLYQAIPANTRISESYLVDLGWVNKLEDRLVTPAVRELHQADFELFADTVDERAQQYGMVLECSADPNLKSDRHGGLEGSFRVKFVSAEGPYSPYYDDNVIIRSKMFPDIHAYLGYFERYCYWRPKMSQQDVTSAAIEIVNKYHDSIEELNAKIDKTNSNISKLDSYKAICEDIANQLTQHFPGLRVEPSRPSDKWIISEGPRAEFYLIYNGDFLDNLRVKDVFHADMNKLIKNMKRRLQRIDQQGTKDESGFTYL